MNDQQRIQANENEAVRRIWVFGILSGVGLLLIAFSPARAIFVLLALVYLALATTIMAWPRTNRQHPLTVEVEMHELIIRVGMDTLASTVVSLNLIDPEDPDKPKSLPAWRITKPRTFACEVRDMLLMPMGQKHQTAIEYLLDETCEAVLTEGSKAAVRSE